MNVQRHNKRHVDHLKKAVRYISRLGVVIRPFSQLYVFTFQYSKRSLFLFFIGAFINYTCIKIFNGMFLYDDYYYIVLNILY